MSKIITFTKIIKNVILLYLLFVKVIFAKSYYFINHNDRFIHVTAYFDKTYLINDLYIPTKIWGTDYTPQIKNINVKQGKYTNHNKVYNFSNTFRTKVEYQLVNIQQKEYMLRFPDTYNHYITKNQFIIIGMGAFIYPFNLNDNAEIIIKINSDVNIASNVKSYLWNKKSITTSLSHLSDTIILGGANIDYISKSGSNLITLNINTKHQKRIKEIIIKSIIKFNKFWQKQNVLLKDKNFIILGPPIGVNKNSCVANVQRNTILAFIVPEINEDEVLSNLIEHELQHFIFGCNMLKGPKWFVEGFADYYRDKIKMFYVNNIEHFKNQYYRVAASYYDSKYRDLSDIEIEKLFFENKKIEKLPYKKGYLIAGKIDTIANLDNIIKKFITSCETTNNCIFNLESLIKNSSNLSDTDQQKIKTIIREFDHLKIDDFQNFQPN